MKILHNTGKGPDNSSDWLLATTRVATFLVIAAISAHLPARAQEACTQKSKAVCRTATISVADLDLSTTAGMQSAQQRVHATARRLCAKVVNPWTLSHQQDYVACMDATMAAALRQLPAPAVAANSTAR
jgi:UrcA family protein